MLTKIQSIRTFRFRLLFINWPTRSLGLEVYYATTTTSHAPNDYAEIPKIAGAGVSQILMGIISL
jgi:hypothetical protein